VNKNKKKTLKTLFYLKIKKVFYIYRMT